MTNMDLWNAVSTTDPKNTKHINQRGGFTAIDAYSQIMAATEQFGPVGQGWGWEIKDFQYPPNDTMVVHLRMWHKEWNTGRDFSVCGQASLYTKGAGPKPDADCAKKAVTDAITKGLSYLGFNADVFLGKFDDNKYVEGLKNGTNKWHGPLNKTALKEKLRQLDKGMRGCANEGDLTGTIISYATAVDQAKKDLPKWHKAYLDAVATKRETFEPSKLGSG